MTKPSIDRIIRDSRAECLVLSQGEAKVMVDEIVRLRGALHDIVEATQTGIMGDDVIWYSEIETLFDFCMSALYPGAEQPVLPGSEDADASKDKRAIDQHIVIDLYRREDGGLRVAGRGDARGLGVSGELPGDVLAKLWPALRALKHPITILE